MGMQFFCLKIFSLFFQDFHKTVAQQCPHDVDKRVKKWYNPYQGITAQSKEAVKK